MKKSFKTAFLYIGTVIGAGFSSGREIALFFGDATPFNVALSAVFMALLAFMFLSAGKLGLIPRGKLVRTLITFSASISLVAMLAGGEYVMHTMTGVPLLALVMAILGALVVSCGIEKIKVVNLVLVPLIAGSIALIFFKIPHATGNLPFSILKPIAYSGLDILLGGIIVGEEGKDMNMKEIFLSSLLVCGVLFGMLYMLQTVVLADTNGSLMPVFAISSRLHLQAICGVLIASAIFTTLVSSLKIVSDGMLLFCSGFAKLRPLANENNKSVVVMFALVIFYPLSFFGFGKIVDTLYPVNSALGVLLALVVMLKIILHFASCIVQKRKLKATATQALQATRGKQSSNKHFSTSRIERKHAKIKSSAKVRSAKTIRVFCHSSSLSKSEKSSSSSSLLSFQRSSNGERRESSSSSSSPLR